MVALKSERRALLWRVWADTLPGAVDKTASLDEIVGILEQEVKAKKARAYIGAGRILDDDDPARDEKNQIYIAAINRDDAAKAITILLNRGDPDAVSPAFINSETSAVRVEHPKEKETPGWSAHLVISTDVDNKRHRACFEKMPHVSSSLVALAVDKIITRATYKSSKYMVKQKIIEGKTVTTKIIGYRPVLRTHRVPSENLIRDLGKGELSSITLTKSTEFYNGVGASKLIKKQEEKIVIRTEKADAGLIEKLVRNITKKAKQEKFEHVSFQLENLPGGATNNPTIDLTKEDALEELYVRAQRLTGFDAVLEGCYADICAEIEKKMVALVHDDTLW